ncbi:MAG: sugar phosphate isomerase/epimerase, partial [Armatimonadota bacterium]|nr:sugar phosphate isomerase/epimerase [Armatimonadota bacterium]
FYNVAGALQAVAEIAEPAQLENVGLLVDCWHWYTSGGTTMDLASIPVEQVVHIHINDAPDIPRDEQVDNVRLLPGASGVIDIVGFLKTLKAIGCDGPVAVETFSDELRALPSDEAAARAAAAVTQVFQAAEITPVRLL